MLTWRQRYYFFFLYLLVDWNANKTLNLVFFMKIIDVYSFCLFFAYKIKNVICISNWKFNKIRCLKQLIIKKKYSMKNSSCTSSIKIARQHITEEVEVIEELKQVSFKYGLTKLQQLNHSFQNCLLTNCLLIWYLKLDFI